MAKESQTEQLSRGEAFRLDMYFWLQALVAALVALILVFTFIGRVIGVKGSSMVPTLQNGNMVLLQTIGYEPAQNDVVVVTHRSFSEDPIIKRVIAVAGQTVVVNYDENTVTVDGVLLNETYINYADSDPMGTHVGAVSYDVPEGHIFVMGDNRNHSTDSRSASIGFVDLREVLGHAHAVVFPTSNFGWIE